MLKLPQLGSLNMEEQQLYSKLHQHICAPPLSNVWTQPLHGGKSIWHCMSDLLWTMWTKRSHRQYSVWYSKNVAVNIISCIHYFANIADSASKSLYHKQLPAWKKKGLRKQWKITTKLSCAQKNNNFLHHLANFSLSGLSHRGVAQHRDSDIQRHIAQCFINIMSLTILLTKQGKV